MSMPVSTHLLPKSTLRAATTFVDGDGDALWCTPYCSATEEFVNLHRTSIHPGEALSSANGQHHFDSMRRYRSVHGASECEA